MIFMDRANTTKSLLRVKLLAKCGGDDPQKAWSQFLPHDNPHVGSCEFLFDSKERDYDWLVVYDDLPSSDKKERFTHSEEVLACSRRNTLLVTTEPITIKTYGTAYPRQFGHVLTSQEEWAIDHPGVIRSQPALIWFYGKSWSEIAREDTLTKDSIISTVCSSKKQKHTLHHYRHRLTAQLKQKIPELSVYGHGVRPLEYKWQSLEPYSYHLAIENHAARHHWTEKLADAFLGQTLPFYYGCPNVYDYFPEESLIPISLFHPDHTAEVIQRAIKDGEYGKRRGAILESRKRVLERYGIFSVLSEIVEERHQADRTDVGEKIESRHALRRNHPISALHYGWERLYARLRSLAYNRKLAKSPRDFLCQ